MLVNQKLVMYQHPIPLSLMQLALQFGGNEVSHLREEGIHDKIGKDLGRQSYNWKCVI